MVASRSEAALAIESGKVSVGDRAKIKASTLVRPDEPILRSSPARRFASRGGDKLDAALDGFGIDVAGRLALDAGASSGGFTDCLLDRGAAHVVAVDVGYGQLHWRLRHDPRVTVLERTNVRNLEPHQLPYRADLITADLSFISLRLALGSLVLCSSPGAEFVLLVKPQFEAGRGHVGRGGVVSEPQTWLQALYGVAAACIEQGLAPVGTMVSPLLGPAGNVEFFLRATGERGPLPGIEDSTRLGLDFDRALQEASALVDRRTGRSSPAASRG